MYLKLPCLRIRIVRARMGTSHIVIPDDSPKPGRVGQTSLQLFIGTLLLYCPATGSIRLTDIRKDRSERFQTGIVWLSPSYQPSRCKCTG